ncbi:MAG: Tungsten-containing aldehyde ferredoxin oxidoreductase [Candidatus Bathyarchaeota archaeon BA1]|nr:MAG: Tungsten-containing aldehyde ferredoxin oxidoreductase [Candidatus Bathyarchaeota archaeon BA1]
MNGWMGEIVRVNLSRGEVVTQKLDENTTKNFLGGRGLGVRVLYDELKPKTNPLSPENKIVFATGPVTGTKAPTSGRYCVISKSPLTGTIFDSHSGGFWGPELKFAGYDAAIIEGKAETPVYIWINDGGVEIRGASEVWGLDTHMTTERLIKETDPKAKVACIGPAGERQVSLAAIINDRHRAAGRGGLGAVMGSKNLKAVVVRGTCRVDVADEGGFSEALDESLMVIRKNPITDKSLPTLGTAVLVNLINEHGMYPTRNFQEGVFEDAEGISGEKIAETILNGRRACYACPIACGRITKTSEKEGEGPEYETAWAFSAQCGINDLTQVTHANYLCNELGLDTISTGNTIGCAMEMSQKGFLREKIEFGDADKLVELVKKIALREGIGKELGEGSKRLAERHGCPELAMQVKGLELPAYDPRGAQGHALAYATSNRGGCHLRAYLIGPEILGTPALVDRFRPDGKADLVITYQNLFAALDSMILCVFTSFALSPDHYAKFTSAVTGLRFADEDVMKIGERIWNLERLFNMREGFGKKDDTLPLRFLKTPLPEGGSRGRRVLLDKMLKEYYDLRGWDGEGFPLKSKLKELGLS